MGQVVFKDVTGSRHMYLNTKLGNTTLTALVDTGASGAPFLLKSICERLYISQLPLAHPINLVGFDGKIGAQVTHKASVPLAIGRHCETLSAFVIHSCKYDLVLGLPWLEMRAPFVDWKNNTLTFGENCLERNCCEFETAIPHTNSVNLNLEGSYEATPKLSGQQNPLKSSWTLPLRVAAPVFALIAQQPENHIFALSLRDLELSIESSMERLPTVRINNTYIVILKNADPKLFLPNQYHVYLDVFERKPYSMNQKELKALREYLDQELSKGFIRISRSPIAAPTLFIKKPNGDLRFCIDYRSLNAISVKNRHALPLISETLSQLSRAKYYTKLDIISACNKLRIKEGDEWKAAFTCRYGFFEPLVLPFGLCNGPVYFQAYVNYALRGLLDRFCIVYMDDILIYSDNLVDHRKHARTVLARLREHGLQVDIANCNFETTEVIYLGLIVSTRGISMDPKKVACVQE
ncbi:hypothetical protein K3495_g11636 [Podosphaera aphanis]|nr:hypothetical protein K3495_g11636 [Podosphaera aphanis]